jgi:short-subunit dehydrogenase
MKAAKPSPTAKVCVIVGAGPGIGEALAMDFARLGYDIALVARNVAKFTEFLLEISKLGRRAHAFGADAADETSLRDAIARAQAELGHVEVLVYNAASGRRSKPSVLKTAEMLEEFRINVGGALIAAQCVADGMKARRRGTILFTGGSFAYEPAAEYSSLSLGKAALRNLTYSLAQELGAFDIHVATVTVYGFVQRGTHFDPRRIAKSFVELHHQPKGHFDVEKVYK